MNCELCSTSDSQKLFSKWGFDIHRCSRCSYVFTAIPESFDTSILYDEGYFQGQHKDGYADYMTSEFVLRKEFAATVRHLRGHLNDGAHILEIGCAYGYFMKEANQFFKTTGIDVSHDAVAVAKNQGLNAHTGILTK